MYVYVSSASFSYFFVQFFKQMRSSHFNVCVVERWKGEDLGEHFLTKLGKF
jgi:hypothetical protein